MQIAFDAKRAFNNQSGLGNYSRNLLNALFKYYPENKYLLYTPRKKGEIFNPVNACCEVKLPYRTVDKAFPSYWRSFSVINDLKKDQPDLYHGLSHEIPFGIEKTKIKSVVTIHDLIFFRYPELYKWADRFIYKKKFSYACNNADRIIAVSNQTANDIQEFFHIGPEKIDVVYQGYNTFFEIAKTEEEKHLIRKKYSLPQNYVLYVGTIEKRKNLLSLIKAVHSAGIDIPLVAIGRKTNYFNEIKTYIEKFNFKNVYFIDTVKNEELSGFYQMANVFVYPSIFEGFGIPILEALVSGTPVITSRGGCFAEAGGPGSLYVNPLDIEEIGYSLKKILSDDSLRKKMINEGKQYSLNFSQKNIADNTMKVYRKIL